MIELPVTTRVKELIGDEVCMGTYGLVELEVKALEQQLKDCKEVAEKLWDLLDDIDTAEDMFKPPINSHFKYVHNKHRERFKYIDTDGYKLIWKGGKDD